MIPRSLERRGCVVNHESLQAICPSSCLDIYLGMPRRYRHDFNVPPGLPCYLLLQTHLNIHNMGTSKSHCIELLNLGQQPLRLGLYLLRLEQSILRHGEVGLRATEQPWKGWTSGAPQTDQPPSIRLHGNHLTLSKVAHNFNKEVLFSEWSC